MARGPKKEIVYTGRALKIHEKVVKLETDLKAAREELKVAYKEQLKAENMEKKKKEKEEQDKLMEAIRTSGKTAEEILALLNQ